MFIVHGKQMLKCSEEAVRATARLQAVLLHDHFELYNCLPGLAINSSNYLAVSYCSTPVYPAGCTTAMHTCNAKHQ